MKTITSTIVVLLLMAALVHAHEIEIRAMGDDGNPIAGANAVISFMRSGNGNSKVYRGATKEDGIFSARDQIIIGAFVKVTKAGFYESVIESGFDDEDHKFDVIMRRIETPVPLVVREVELAVPDTEELIGFDFAVGDWLPPFGKGSVADIEVEFSKAMNGLDYTGEKLERVLEMSKRAATARGEEWTESDFHRRVGKWDATVKVTFPTVDGGVVELDGGFVPYSGLTMPHLAPEDGYADSLEIEASTYDSSKISHTQTPLFLRTRVEKRGEEIVRAHYAKVPGGISVDARGSLKFRYYFNPRENDRNLEFDPNGNLAEDQDKRFPP
jgi:hypothetical protein